MPVVAEITGLTYTHGGHMSKLILKNARLIDGTGSQPRERATVVVVDGKISDVSYEAAAVSQDFDPVALSKLEAHEREIVNKRYGFEGSRLYNPEELAAEMGIAPKQLRDVE